MRVGAIAAAALVAVIATPMLASAATCTVPQKTLTFSCDSACSNQYSPCWRNASITSTSPSCPYECYDIYFSDTAKTNFVFLVPFKAADNSAYAAADAKSADLKTYIYKSNDLVSKIGTLALPSSTTKVTLIGGSFYKTKYIKGRVVTLDLADDLVAKQTQVTDAYLASIDLRTAVKAMTTMLPLSTKVINFENNLLEDFPADFAKFTTLQELSLSNNYITRVDASAAIDTISLLALDVNNVSSFNAMFKNTTLVALSANMLSEYPTVLSEYPRLETLYLDHNSITEVDKSHVTDSLTKLYLGVNSITKFDAVFPKLTYLDLRSNNLTKIPDAIFKHTSLTFLNLAGNQLKNVTLTNDQSTFFINLKNFTFDGTVFKDCFVYEQKEVHGTKFCIYESPGSGGASPGDDSGSSSTGLIVGIVCGAVAVVGIALFFCVRARKSKGKRNDAGSYDGTLQPTQNGTTSGGSTSLWSDAELLAIKVNADDIEDIKAIGKGAYGDVWLVKYRRTQLLASKRLRKSGLSQSQTQNFIEEIKLVAKLEHPHIVRLVGAAWTIQSDLQALFEYMDGSDLRDFLETAHTSRPWTPEKLQIAIDVVEALVYVHSFSPPLVHRDLKSRNVLLSSELQAKLTDFGVSRFRSVDNTMTAGVGTGKWLAPEVIAGATDYGSAADIFSFGAVLVELDTHKLPYDEVRGPNGNRLADVALLQMVSMGQLTPTFSQSCPEKIAEIGTRCFALNPSERPAAAEIAYALRQLKKSMYR